MENEKEKTTPKSNSSSNIANAPNNILLVLVGFLLGVIVCYVATNNIISTKDSKETSKEKKVFKSDKEISDKSTPSPKTDESLPPNHPNIKDIEEQIKATIDFGKKNTDYDSQLKVGGYLYTQVNMMEEAKPFLLKANELKPDEFEPLLLLGALCFDLARQKNDMLIMQEAIKWYEKCLKIKPDELDILTDTAIAYQHIVPPNHKKALEYFDKTLSKNSKHLPALYNKTRSYIELKDLQSAQKTFDLFKQSANDPANESFKELTKSLEEEINKLIKIK